MHVQSTLNAANKAENVPVAVFKYRGKRKFLTKEKEYEETVKIVKEAFKIVHDVSFYTSTLDVCRDQFVEIDSSAYSALKAVLDEILVVEAGTEPEEATVNRKLKARVSTATVSASSSAFSVARQLQPRASGAETSSARTVQGPRTSLIRPQPQRTSAVHETVTRKGSNGSLDVKDYQSASEADNENEREVAAEAQQEPELEDEDERAAREASEPVDEEEEEVEQDGEQDEDDLFGDAEEEVDAEDEGAHKDEQGRRTSDEFDMVPERSYHADSPPEQRKAAAGLQSPQPAVKPPSKSQAQLAEELFPESPSPPARTKPRPARSSDLPVKPERSPNLGLKPEHSSSKRATTVTTGTTSSRSPSKPNATKTVNATPANIDDNARIAIVIQTMADGDEDVQSATFKMRGRHMVHKILKTACGNFGLDFDSASLFLAQDVYDIDGILVETEYVHCPNDRSAAQCGITDGAKLVIQIETDSD